ncbi:hypothetical protein L6Q96_16330 [Candidatus Binatia bacterium]|nr:hypothetical protein [Candidatus Binatia bacterium]
MVVRTLAGAVALLTVWGCSVSRQREDASRGVVTDQPDPQEAAATYVAELAPYLTRVEGRCQTDLVRSRFVAYFGDGEVRYVIEQTDASEPGAAVAVNEYFFAAGRLFHYHENRRAMARHDGFPNATAVVLRLSFDDTGALSRATQTVDGVPTAVTDDEVMAVRRHVEHLRLAARDAYLRGRRTVRR